MKNILITGIARGLGKHLAEFFLSKGAIVYGTTRNVSIVKKRNNLHVFFLDLCNKKSIANLVNFFRKKRIPLDALIHNAGTAYLDPIEIMEEKEYREIFEVNFFGPVALTTGLLSNLRMSQKSNLLYISSIVSIDCWPYLGAYAASKRAMESIAFEWAVLLKNWNICVSVIQPNPLPTDMDIKRSKNSKKSCYPELENRLLQWEGIQETIELIDSILKDKAPQFQYQTGKYSRKTAKTFLKEKAYQNSLETNQIAFNKLMSKHSLATQVLE